MHSEESYGKWTVRVNAWKAQATQPQQRVKLVLPRRPRRGQTACGLPLTPCCLIVEEKLRPSPQTAGHGGSIVPRTYATVTRLYSWPPRDFGGRPGRGGAGCCSGPAQSLPGSGSPAATQHLVQGASISVPPFSRKQGWRLYLSYRVAERVNRGHAHSVPGTESGPGLWFLF